LVRITSSLVGNQVLAKNSKNDYLKHINGLKYFCAMIGDYESMLMLSDYAPKPMAPSIKSSTVSEFVRWKRNSMGSVLYSMRGEAMVDVCGNLLLSTASMIGQPIVCTKTWNDPQVVRQFNSAVVCLHASRNQRGKYLDICKDCFDMPEEDRHKGCRFHSGSPLVWRQGIV
jgi:hypothetical protein